MPKKREIYYVYECTYTISAHGRGLVGHRVVNYLLPWHKGKSTYKTVGEFGQGAPLGATCSNIRSKTFFYEFRCCAKSLGNIVRKVVAVFQ